MEGSASGFSSVEIETETETSTWITSTTEQPKITTTSSVSKFTYYVKIKCSFMNFYSDYLGDNGYFHDRTCDIYHHDCELYFDERHRFFIHVGLHNH